MRKQILAVLLALALGSSLLSTTALAAESSPTVTKVLWEEDAAGTVSFANLETRVRANNENLLALDETIASVEALDYDKMYEDLRTQLNKIANLQWMLIVSGQGESYTSAQLEQSYEAMRKSFDAIKDGELQEDNAGVVRQLRSAENQVVMASESLYVALTGMEVQERSLQRSLDALDRTVAEMQLRYQLGQISALQLKQVQSSRASLASGLETLHMNMQNYNMQLELMIGGELTGKLVLGALPQVQPSQLEKLNQESDLAAAKEASYELYAAKKTLEDAEETYRDAGKDYGYNENKYQFVSAKHTWQAAQHTYQATVQSFEMRFQTTYLQTMDYQQILNAAKVALDAETASYAATELKYQQGTISKNALLDAKDKVTAAQESVQTAATNLFSAYHTYRWAVDHGILN